jgi:hypothetical protein
MSSIYRGAIKVIVWHGEAEDNSDILFDLLQKTKSDLNGDEDLLENRRQGVVMRKYTFRQIDFALQGLYVRPYWKTVWIIQEILSASEVELLCSSKGLSWV